MSVTLFCVCDQEWCWCTNQIVLDDDDPRLDNFAAPEIACEDCKRGRHKETP